jgi:hypothetical protein
VWASALLLVARKNKGPSIAARPFIFLVALQGFEPRTCGL